MQKLSKIIDWGFISNLLFLMFFLSEALNKIPKTHEGYGEFFSQTVKSIAIMGCLCFLIREKDYKFLFAIFGLFLVYVMSQYWLLDEYSFKSLGYFLRYVFPICLFRTYNKIEKTNKLFSLYEPLIFFNSLLILAGLIFEINVLKTYSGQRFGYSGLIYASATATYTYLYTIFLIIQKLVSGLEIKWKESVILLSCLFIGTKSIYLALFVFALLYLRYRYCKFRVVVDISFFIVGASLFYLIFYRSGIFSAITKEKGVLTSLLSYRNELFLDKTLPYVYEKWSVVNYIFGGYSNSLVKSQMDAVDLILMFGILGSIYFLWIYSKTYFKNQLTKLDYKIYTVLFFIIFVSGNFFMYSTTQLFALIYKDRLSRLKEELI